MKKNVLILLLLFSAILQSQNRKTVFKSSTQKSYVKKMPSKTAPDLTKINDSVAALIPQKMNGKFGFVNQHGKFIIEPEYSNVGFFTEDCHLLNSPNEKVRKFGTGQYASVQKDNINYRIDDMGKIVYTFKDSDLGQCKPQFKEQIYNAYVQNGFYGIIERKTFTNAADYRQYVIYPQYQYLHILEGDDLKNPMIIASVNDRFGVIDIHNKVIIPFVYVDIKRNMSWKIARLFEVSKDGKEFYFVDINNKAY